MEYSYCRVLSESKICSHFPTVVRGTGNSRAGPVCRYCSYKQSMAVLGLTPGQTAVWGSTGTRVGALFGSAREVGSREAPVAPGQPAGPRPPSPGKRQNAPSLASLGKGRNKQFWQNLIALDAQIATFGCFCPFDSQIRVPALTAAESMVGCQLLALWDALWRVQPPPPIGCRGWAPVGPERCPIRSR